MNERKDSPDTSVSSQTGQNMSDASAPSNSPKKKSGRIGLWVRRILTVICLAVIALASWNLYSIWESGNAVRREADQLAQYLKPAQTTTEKEDSSQRPSESAPAVFEPDWAGLKAANPNVEAWLIVPGTGISFPVVQGSNNSYYLNHTYTGAYSTLGSIFMDSAADKNFHTDNTLIYGHSVDIGGMFTNLKLFADRSFFDSHPYFWLLTPEQNYRCEIIAFYQGSDTGAAIYTDSFGDFRSEVLEEIEQQSLYTRDVDTEGHRFVSLSTCNLSYGFSSDQRYVLMGVMEDWDEPIPQSEAN